MFEFESFADPETGQSHRQWRDHAADATFTFVKNVFGAPAGIFMLEVKGRSIPLLAEQRSSIDRAAGKKVFIWNIVDFGAETLSLVGMKPYVFTSKREKEAMLSVASEALQAFGFGFKFNGAQMRAAGELVGVSYQGRPICTPK